MKRWNQWRKSEVDNPRVDAFLADVLAVCKRHGLAICHEDEHGAFIVRDYGDMELWWHSLLEAFDDTGRLGKEPYGKTA